MTAPFLLAFVAGGLLAQQPQNPSPMVEHTRPHPRLKQEKPPGRREKLELGTLFVPASCKPKQGGPLLVCFHAGTWIPEVAAARRRLTVVWIQIGAGSSVYAKPFADPQRFGALVREAEAKAGIAFGPLWLASWSAGYGAIREILRVEEYYVRIERVLLIDGLHTGYAGGRPGPSESQIETGPLEVFRKFAAAAVAGHKAMMVTHSEIFPGTFASTTETADWLLRELGIQRRPVLRWGPMRTQQLSEARRGGFRLSGYAGNSAPDHVDQLHSLPEYLKWFRRKQTVSLP